MFLFIVVIELVTLKLPSGVYILHLEDRLNLVWEKGFLFLSRAKRATLSLIGVDGEVRRGVDIL